MRAPEKSFDRARRFRREMTLPEVVLWQALRKCQLTQLRFRRQHPIGPYILDFYCASLHLAVEVDGFAHDTAAQARRDERRNAWLEARGIKVLRFRAADVLRDEGLDGVLRAIELVAAPPPTRDARHLPRDAGEEPGRKALLPLAAEGGIVQGFAPARNM